MLNYFFIGLYILFALTAVFYAVFLVLVYYWHEKKTTYVVAPLIYTFDFFLIGFLVVCLVSLAIEFLPELIKLI